MKEYHLPLFIHIAEPIAVYVIADKVVGFKEHFTNNFNPGKAFLLLQRLYTNSFTRKAIPKKFHKVLQKKEIGEKNQFNCLAGELGGGFYYCLVLKITIREKSEKPILLNQFGIANKYVNGLYLKKFPKNVELSADEGFSLFANICTSAVCEIIDDIFDIMRIQRKPFDKKIIIKIVEDYYMKYEKFNLNMEHEIVKFGIEYLELLIKQIEDEVITIEELLRLSGAKIIAFLADNKKMKQFILEKVNELRRMEQWKEHQKIKYCSLLAITRDCSKELIPEIEQRMKEKEDYWLKLKKELLKELPKKEGEFVTSLKEELMN